MGWGGWGGVGWGGQICVDVGVVRCHFCSVVRCLALTQHSGTAQSMAQLELEPGSGSSSGSGSGVTGAVVSVSTAGNAARSGRSAAASGSAPGGAAAAFASCCIRLCQYSAVKHRAAAAAAAAPSSAVHDDELDEHDCGNQMGHWFATVPRGRWAGGRGRTAGWTGGGGWTGGRGWTGGAFGCMGIVASVAAWWQAFVHAKPICESLQRLSLLLISCMTSTY